MTVLLHTSLAAIPLIAGIALARKYFWKKIPPQVFVLLWVLALCRLLIPLWVPVSGERAKPMLNYVYGGLYNATQRTVGAVGERLVFALWLVGAAVVLISQLAAHFRTYRQWREALPLDNPAAEIWLAQHPCRRRVRVVKAQMEEAPFCVGTFRPLIVLPLNIETESDATIAQVLAHEWAHIRGFHPLLKYILLAACSLHWFNPLVWLLAALFARDMELAADDGALRVLGRKEAKNYARMLLQMEEQSTVSGGVSALGAPSLQERLEIILFKNYSQKYAIAIIVGCVFLFGCIICVPNKAIVGKEEEGNKYRQSYGETINTYLERMNEQGYTFSENYSF